MRVRLRSNENALVWLEQEQLSAVKISAVIPVYNEEEVIDEFSGRLLESLKETADDY